MGHVINWYQVLSTYHFFWHQKSKWRPKMAAKILVIMYEAAYDFRLHLSVYFSTWTCDRNDIFSFYFLLISIYFYLFLFIHSFIYFIHLFIHL